jgi:hypothetical protein
MQTQKDDENKVVSLFDRQKATKESSETTEAPKQESFDFEEIMRRNTENKNRMQKERSKSNRGVIRSYRLKH